MFLFSGFIVYPTFSVVFVLPYIVHIYTLFLISRKSLYRELNLSRSTKIFEEKMNLKMVLVRPKGIDCSLRTPMKPPPTYPRNGKERHTVIQIVSDRPSL